MTKYTSYSLKLVGVKRETVHLCYSVIRLLSSVVTDNSPVWSSTYVCSSDRIKHASNLQGDLHHIPIQHWMGTSQIIRSDQTSLNPQQNWRRGKRPSLFICRFSAPANLFCLCSKTIWKTRVKSTVPSSWKEAEQNTNPVATGLKTQ